MDNQVPVVPAPSLAAQPPTIQYVRFEEPIKTATNKQPTSVVEIRNDGVNKIVSDIDKDTLFEAVGRAMVSGGASYFMDKDSFGDADTTGVPAMAQGINTIDLAPSDGSQKINVRVVTNDKWKDSAKLWLGSVDYLSNVDMTVHDLEGAQPDVQLTSGLIVHVAGTFEKDGVQYFRTVSSVQNNAWYGIPAQTLHRAHPSDDDEDIKGLLDIPQKQPIKLTPKESFMTRLAAAIGRVLRSRKA